ncbi:MAG: DNA alkylation repair protein [Bacilli bacterium]|nr:DNA alkylation repair protein [Bacilli bacterium]
MTYVELKDFLLSNADKKFSEFSKTLSNSEYKVIGVKNPVLRDLIKQHVKDEELKVEDFKIGEYLEIDFVYFGLSLVRLKSIDEQFKFLETNIKYAKSWAITDTVSTYLKKHDFDKYFAFFKRLYNSPHTYDRRMAYIVGLKHYKDKRILDVLPYISMNDEYMVMMAEAWLLATVAIQFPNEVFEYLVGCKDITLKRKTISKINESFRISDELKIKFKELRKE